MKPEKQKQNRKKEMICQEHLHLVKQRKVISKHEVRKLFDTINRKSKEAGSERPELTKEFAKLREITDNYTVPSDVCESYEAVYNMLAEVDKAYHI